MHVSPNNIVPAHLSVVNHFSKGRRTFLGRSPLISSVVRGPFLNKRPSASLPSFFCFFRQSLCLQPMHGPSEAWNGSINARTRQQAGSCRILKKDALTLFLQMATCQPAIDILPLFYMHYAEFEFIRPWIRNYFSFNIINSCARRFYGKCALKRKNP